MQPVTPKARLAVSYWPAAAGSRASLAREGRAELVLRAAFVDGNLVGWNQHDPAIVPGHKRLAGSLVNEQRLVGGFVHRSFDRQNLGVELGESRVVMRSGAHGCGSVLMIPFQIWSR